MSLINATFSANPLTLPANIAEANAYLEGSSAAEIITWALARASNPVVSTNFRPRAAALLHMVTRACPDIPVIWVDTGYNTPATYRYIEELRERLKLNLRTYTPHVTVARRAANGGLPAIESPQFARFVHETKLEPFERAFNELKPDVWFTGVRRDQNEFRSGLGVVSRGAQNTLRVAPVFEWNEQALAEYLGQQGVPDNEDYVDPTKPGAKLECGLQLLK
ncbi:MAG: phosphoadenosine phosphosulfate reductase family protein [Proteobacteria bacterium]|nr:phosphoadenosine phosphosulfate reductase family protein [Pseudomonadota bacterium]